MNEKIQSKKTKFMKAVWCTLQSMIRKDFWKLKSKRMIDAHKEGDKMAAEY